MVFWMCGYPVRKNVYGNHLLFANLSWKLLENYFRQTNLFQKQNLGLQGLLYREVYISPQERNLLNIQSIR